MNWRLGLFRTWLVFSAAWIGAWTAWSFIQWRGTTYLITEPVGITFEVTGPAEIPFDQVVSFLRNSDSAKKLYESCAKSPQPRCAYRLFVEIPNHVNIAQLLLKAFGGPFVAFGIGFAGFWASNMVGSERSAQIK